MVEDITNGGISSRFVLKIIILVNKFLGPSQFLLDLLGHNNAMPIKKTKPLLRIMWQPGNVSIRECR